ncbi:MAG: EAL domain-containing protein [Ilumatobacteraceae bacterium]
MSRGAVRGDRTVATLTLWSRFGMFDDSNIDRFDRTAAGSPLAVAQLPEAPIRAAHVVSSDAVPPIDVRRALDEGRIEPWWQPQVDCDGRIVALEMLLRMHDDDGQIVPLNVAIPAAEQLGLMSTIGRSLRRGANSRRGGSRWASSGSVSTCRSTS